MSDIIDIKKWAMKHLVNEAERKIEETFGRYTDNFDSYSIEEDINKLVDYLSESRQMAYDRYVEFTSTDGKPSEITLDVTIQPESPAKYISHEFKIIGGTGGQYITGESGLKGWIGTPGPVGIGVGSHLKVLSEDQMDDRLLLENVDTLTFVGISRIDGRPVFKIKDSEKYGKIRADLEKIGSIHYVNDITGEI